MQNNTDVISRSEQATASSAHSRINIPLNMENWRALAEPVQQLLLWFHQHCLDEALDLKAAGQALNYDTSTVFRVLKGTYEGNWSNVTKAIESYRKVVETRGTIQRQEFVHNSITKMIFAGLDYALANNSITLVTGESRMGKTTAAKAWRDENNHGRSVFVTAPAYGGTKALLRDIAAAVGVNKNLNVSQMHEAILRAFNRHRILIIDEAHRLMPNDRRTVNNTFLEIIRDIHDRSGCAVALLATARFDTLLKAGEYMYEQLLGRIGMPIRLKRKIGWGDVEPIVKQFIRRPSARLQAACEEVANAMGRLGILVETVRVASRMAGKKKQDLAEEHVFAAMALRRQMQGETNYAAK